MFSRIIHKGLILPIDNFVLDTLNIIYKISLFSVVVRQNQNLKIFKFIQLTYQDQMTSVKNRSRNITVLIAR